MAVTPDRFASSPFRPGESPFLVKGNIIIGCQEYMADALPGGFEATKAALSDEWRRYFDQRFLASSLYDCFPFAVLLYMAADLAGQPANAFLSRAFETQAQRGQQGVYKLLLRAISPEMLVKRLPSVGSQLFNFTTSEVKQIAPGHWHNIIQGVPELLREVYCTSSGAFVSRALRTTGARDFEHRWLEPQPATSAHGVEIVTLTRELRWRAKS
jgi:hypothetical protein